MRTLTRGSLLIGFALFSCAAWAVPPITPFDIAPAAFTQADPEVASNGRGVVAVWWDLRKSAHFDSHPAIFATRLDEDGRSLDPLGIEIARETYGTQQLASNGNGYVVVYTDEHGVRARHLGDDARPDAAPFTIAERGFVAGLGSSGTSYCAVLAHIANSSAVIFDSDGTVLRRVALSGWAAAVVGTGDGGFVVITVQNGCSITPCFSTIAATTIAPDGSLSERIVAVPEIEPRLLHAASNGSRILVGWLGMEGQRAAVEYAAVPMDGQPAGPVHHLEQTEEAQGNRDLGLAVASDGGSFLVVWTPLGPDAERSVQGVRINAEGEPRDAEPFELPAGTESLRAARGASNLVFVSELDETDVVARAVPSFDALPELPAASIIAFSANPQSEPDAATNGSIVLTVASEGDSYGMIAASRFTAGTEESGARLLLADAIPYVTQGAPSVAYARDVFLTVWRERADNSTRILAKRISSTGTVLDPEPLVLAHDPVSYDYFPDTATGSDGVTFLVVWHSGNEIRARRVRRDGTILGAAITISRHPAGQTRERRTPAVIWTGTTYLVAWSEFIVPDGSVSQQNPTRVAYRLARVTRDGTVLDATESASLFELVGAAHGLTLTRSPDRILFAAATGSHLDTPWSVDVMSLDLDGNPMSSTPVRLAETAHPSQIMNAAAAWDGKAFLVFWNDRSADESRIRGAKLDAQGTVLSNFEASGGASYYPTAVSIDRGVLLLHTKVANANVARLSARVFPLVTERKRSVGH